MVCLASEIFILGGFVLNLEISFDFREKQPRSADISDISRYVSIMSFWDCYSRFHCYKTFPNIILDQENFYFWGICLVFEDIIRFSLKSAFWQFISGLYEHHEFLRLLQQVPLLQTLPKYYFRRENFYFRGISLGFEEIIGLKTQFEQIQYLF